MVRYCAIRLIQILNTQTRPKHLKKVLKLNSDPLRWDFLSERPIQKESPTPKKRKLKYNGHFFAMGLERFDDFFGMFRPASLQHQLHIRLI
jgi:hypothetical protein